MIAHEISTIKLIHHSYYHWFALTGRAQPDRESNPNLKLKTANWISWPHADRRCQIQDGKTVMGAGVYHPMSDSKNLVEPNGACTTDTIGRAELAATTAALTNTYTLPQTALAHFTNSKSKSCIQRGTGIMYKEMF
eukprot:1160860-Pelagomonas_calceolata.AAC.1